MFEALKENEINIGVLPELNTPWTPDKLTKYMKLGAEVISKLGVDGKGLGRWAYFCLNGQYNKKIWIVGAYRLGNNKSIGDDTAYQQQCRLLTKQGKENTDPSLEWDKDMVSFLNSIPTKD
eukprot:8582545-Ditylum_brightwellii.AAC.2